MRPLAILMENVPDILNHGGHNIVEEIVEALEPLGYEARYSLINSAHHGVPQMRDRVFMIATYPALGAEIRFPRATYRCDLPPGYSERAPSPCDLSIAPGRGATWSRTPDMQSFLPP